MNRRGTSITEITVILSCIALMSSVGCVFTNARGENMLTRDQSQVKAIFSGFSFWAPSHMGKYPIPGLERRKANVETGEFIKGRGPEDMLVNDHASMLSMCIMQNLFTPEILFAPTEQSEVVYPMEQYNYDLYNAGTSSVFGVDGWTFWDSAFVNDLENSSNNSYGIIPLTGKRKTQNWGISTHSPTRFAIVGTRGPIDGVEDPYSVSNQMHGSDSSWKGVVTFGDGHTEILEAFYPMHATYATEIGYDGRPTQVSSDNIFEEEADQAIDDDYMPSGFQQGQGADAILTHIKFGDVNAKGKGGGVNAGGFLHD